MRKKSKKKQIVAMTLALSVLSSSVGMCGASAAEALPDTDDSGLQVTVVPLADSNADTDTPADDTKPKEQPVASTGDNTDQPTDGEGDGDNTSSDDKPTIERPEQSDTVETLPGTALNIAFPIPVMKTAISSGRSLWFLRLVTPSSMMCL